MNLEWNEREIRNKPTFSLVELFLVLLVGNTEFTNWLTNKWEPINQFAMINLVQCYLSVCGQLETPPSL